MIDQKYDIARHAALLLKLAQSTANPNVAASLITRAADLKAYIDEESNRPDVTPRAPDVDTRPREIVLASANDC
jgi:hypothetical protein